MECPLYKSASITIDIPYDGVLEQILDFIVAERGSFICPAAFLMRFILQILKS